MASCPQGWHLPSGAEWTQLSGHLGGENVSGGMMKEEGINRWVNPNSGATNESGFTALPGGCLTTGFFDIGYGGYFWSSSAYDDGSAWYRTLMNNSTTIASNRENMSFGFSVRCVHGVTLPQVSTGDVLTYINSTTVDYSGRVISDGGSPVSARGVCWSTSENPTTSDSKTTDGTGMGPYTSNITGLSPNTTYYVRAYATNSQGTAYGEQRTFKTLPASDIVYGSLTDSRDENVYKTVTIGEQVWMAENLAYLPEVSPSSSGSNIEPYYYVYGYQSTNVSAAKATTNYNTYGALYNWPAAMTACPEGWHLPSDDEWTQLENYLIANGYNYDATTTGDKIAISMASTTGWAASDGSGAIGNTNTAYDAYRNMSGFTALPGGYRGDDGTFDYIGYVGYWWSSTQDNTDYACTRFLYHYRNDVDRFHFSKEDGYSVRCVRD